jgi:hypothetical protein
LLPVFFESDEQVCKLGHEQAVGKQRGNARLQAGNGATVLGCEHSAWRRLAVHGTWSGLDGRPRTEYFVF